MVLVCTEKRQVWFSQTTWFIDLLCIWLQALGRLERAHQSIADTLLHLHTFFAADSYEVQREWARFRVKVPAYLHMYSANASGGTHHLAGHAIGRHAGWPADTPAEP